MKTAACEVLGIEFPIIQAPMQGAVGPPLVAAVSNAGRLGMLVPWAGDATALHRDLREICTLTSKPFGVNLNLSFPCDKLLDTCLDEGVPIISVFWGDPTAAAARAKAGGAVVMHTMATAEDACGGLRRRYGRRPGLGGRRSCARDGDHHGPGARRG